MLCQGSPRPPSCSAICKNSQNSEKPSPLAVTTYFNERSHISGEERCGSSVQEPPGAGCQGASRPRPWSHTGQAYFRQQVQEHMQSTRQAHPSLGVQSWLRSHKNTAPAWPTVAAPSLGSERSTDTAWLGPSHIVTVTQLGKRIECGPGPRTPGSCYYAEAQRLSISQGRSRAGQSFLWNVQDPSHPSVLS